jgi:hypothetical protein
VIDRVFCKDDHVLGCCILVCIRHVSAVGGLFDGLTGCREVVV